MYHNSLTMMGAIVYCNSLSMIGAIVYHNSLSMTGALRSLTEVFLSRAPLQMSESRAPLSLASSRFNLGAVVFACKQNPLQVSGRGM